MPGSPVRATIRPRPSLTRSYARISRARCDSRPTVVRRTAAAAGETAGAEPDTRVPVSARSTSFAFGRSDGSLRSICSTSSSITGGTAGFRRPGGSGWSETMLATIDAGVIPRNGRRPAAIS